MNKEEQYQAVLKNNDSIVKDFISVMVKAFHISNLEELNKAQLRFFVKNTLSRIESDNYKLYELRLEVDNAKIEYEEYEKAYVGDMVLDGIGQGKNTGGCKTAADSRPIQKLKYRERYEKLIVEYDNSIEKCNKNHESIIRFVELIPFPKYVIVLKDTHFKGWTESQIAYERDLSVDQVNNYRFRAIMFLTGLIEEIEKK